ncbi:uncharacterized protein N7529_004192 [Penicillium soppii]|uniref:uncharacterized protein n=1 Tax=Penicillium soppii TaxID=69789 RepID=UPI0025476D29|nr:uncharacterized protein N7529_004192 [Penicillium soppii]KAJ5871839.1 hypothetical protein N7529_004192 [Penicillium soppii]
MKLLMIATLLVSLLTSANATVVKAYEGTSCNGEYVGSVSACGSTGLSQNYKVKSLRLDFQKATASFYKEKPDSKGNCVGVRISKNTDQCVTLPTGWDRFGCVNIHGGTC